MTVSDFSRFFPKALSRGRRGAGVFESSIIAVFLLHAPSPAATSGGDPAPVDFTRDVQPILAERCYHCHGPDTAKAGLRFDLRDTVLPPDGEGGAEKGGTGVIAPGDPAHSLFFELLVAHDPQDRMPLEADPLPTGEIEILRRWIEEGADWPEGSRHWAYLPPRHPLPPAVKDEAWPKNEIDRFILARLEEEGLPPSPQAPRTTLIRRLHLDLTGLPPEIDAVDRFLANDSEEAYEGLVEELLASPHYGERWAHRWLDLVRYGDTDGYDGDKVREMWPYRDWVIAAFNRDMPFDQFAIEQIAGDLLPGATPEQRLATGFIRNSPVPQYRFDMLVDRVNTVGTVFLGLTLECAQCHNHKFDPVSQREFYELYALFENSNDVEEALLSPLTGETGNVLVAAPKDKTEPAKLAVDGSPFHPEKPVYPGLPSAFHESPGAEFPTRLELAHWLVDRSNPLLARVVVNRQWEALFGTGLVRTSEDLGLRTERPSHSELLDWLAVEFVERGWSLKEIHRQMVLSATYRQDSRVIPSLLKKDPANRLLARGSRFRVEAELVRDIALSAAGVLNSSLGGPPVFPPQPRGVTEIRFKGAYKWEESAGVDRHRRGLYTFWKRAALYPGLELFDAPRRETSCTTRQRSITPLQALVTLNDPAFVEAAVHLGLRMAEDGCADAGKGIAIGFRRCVSRAPEEDELRELSQFYEAERARFAGDPDSAEALLAYAASREVPVDPAVDALDWAAFAMVANVILNLDETITRP